MSSLFLTTGLMRAGEAGNSAPPLLYFQDETNNMHPLFAKADRLSSEVIGAAVEVHRIMGPGLLESIYERCLLRELELRGIPALNQEEVVIDYKGTVFKEKLKFDLLADGCLLVELKAIRDVLPIHKAQLLSYMKLLNVPLGLLFNFHDVKLVDGISRLSPARCKQALNRRKRRQRSVRTKAEAAASRRNVQTLYK